jgi:hypothetical protein
MRHGAREERTVIAEYDKIDLAIDDFLLASNELLKQGGASWSEVRAHIEKLIVEIATTYPDHQTLTRLGIYIAEQDRFFRTH